MADEPFEKMIRKVMEGLDPLGVTYAIIGGISIPLHIDPNSPVSPRPTKDVDCLVDFDNRVEFNLFEEELRSQGFENDPSSGVICRWIYEGIAVDIMPKDPTILSFQKSDFFSDAFDNLVIKERKGMKIPTVPTSFLLALKIEAFQDRGIDDWMVSHDLQDIMTIIDGKKNAIYEIRNTIDGPWKFIRDWCHNLGEDLFGEWASAHIGDDERGRYIAREIFKESCSRCGENIAEEFDSEYGDLCSYCDHQFYKNVVKG